MSQMSEGSAAFLCVIVVLTPVQEAFQRLLSLLGSVVSQPASLLVLGTYVSLFLKE